MNIQPLHQSRDIPVPKHVATFGAAIVTLALIGLLAACTTITLGGPTISTSGPGITINVKVMHGEDNSTMVVLPVTINGHGPYDFALDTGAATSLIDTPLAQQLGLPQNGSPAPIQGVSGSELAVPVLVNSWHIEKLKLPKMTIQSANLFTTQRGAGIQGLIGSDIWNRFGSFTLNYSDGTLTVPKQIAAIHYPTPVTIPTLSIKEALASARRGLPPAT